MFNMTAFLGFVKLEMSMRTEVLEEVSEIELEV